MKIKLTAPEGHKYMDTMTGKTHSVLVIDSKNRNRFELVADNSEKIMEV